MVRSVRGRITVVATVMVALALAFASFLVLRFVEQDLLVTTERALQAELDLQAAEFPLDALDTEFFEFSLDGSGLRLGVFEQAGLGEGPIAVGSLFTGDIWVAEVLLDVETLQVLDVFDPFTGTTIQDAELTEAIEQLDFGVRDLDGDDGDRFLVGAVARSEVDASLQAVRRALLLTVPILIVAMAALIWWLVGRALRPVTAISDQVSAISTTSLDKRVPVPAGNDEIAGLATVMNGMLARLERGDDRQRAFAADASHELRSPLSTVRAAAEMIERRPDSPRSGELAAAIVAESDRMEALISDLLAMSRAAETDAPLEQVPVDLSALLGALDPLDPLLQRRVESDVIVTGSPSQVERLIDNLVSNAHRHASTKVLVTLRKVSRDGFGWAELRVEDDGGGIALEDREIIFERFSRLDEARSRDDGGAGLGLALVRAIVTRHRGQVVVTDSAELGGASFVVHLPLHSADRT